LVPRPLRKRAPGPTASLHKAAPRARRSRDRPRPKSLLKGDRLGLRQAPQPAYSPPGTFRHPKRSTRDPDRPRGLRPATFSGCLSPSDHKPPPTHPFLPYSPCQRAHRHPRLRSAALLCRQTTPYSHKAGDQQAPFCAYTRH